MTLITMILRIKQDSKNTARETRRIALELLIIKQRKQTHTHTHTYNSIGEETHYVYAEFREKHMVRVTQRRENKISGKIF